MKRSGLSLRTVLFASVSAVIAFGSPAVRGQEPPVVAPTEKQPVVAPPEATADKPDLSLLAKALGGLNTATAFSYQSEMEINGSGKGVTFKGKQKFDFVGQHPNKARVEVETILGDDTDGAKKYVVVSDGAKFWTGQSAAKKYGVKLLAPGALAEDFSSLGLLGALYFNKDLIGGVGQITAENADAILKELKKGNIEFSSANETVDGTSVPVYTMLLTKQFVTMRFFVDPKTGTLSRIELAVKTDGIDLKMSEKILGQSSSPEVKATAFQFVPPAGHQKVPGLSVGLF